jgi:hypothetical protein
MQIAAVVAGLAADLAALGALGDDSTAETAHRLATAMQAPLTARLLELLGQAAAELEAADPGARVEVRLVGDEVNLVLAEAQPGPQAGEPDHESDADARITLRLSAALKARVEAASAREGVSVNTWVGRALRQQVREARQPTVGRRLKGYGRS